MLNAIDQYQLWDFLQKGGVVMLPLGLCSILTVAIVIERLIWGPARWRVIPRDLEREIRSLIQNKCFEELIGLCRRHKSSLARTVLAAVTNAHRSREEIIDAVEVVGRGEALKLSRYIGVLGTIAGVSPLLGLLGTVSGMIKTFSVVGEQGVGNAPALAGGIAEALITTAAGLTIAIPALVFHRYFLHNARSLVIDMERISMELLDQVRMNLENEAGQSTREPKFSRHQAT